MISSHQIHIQFSITAIVKNGVYTIRTLHPPIASPNEFMRVHLILCALFMFIITFMESQSVNQINTMCFYRFCQRVQYNTRQWHGNSIQMRMRAWMYNSAFYPTQYIFMCRIYEYGVVCVYAVVCLRWCGLFSRKINGTQLIKWNSNRVYSRKQFILYRRRIEI